jgi:hypothetical protein
MSYIGQHNIEVNLIYERDCKSLYICYVKIYAPSVSTLKEEANCQTQQK